MTTTETAGTRALAWINSMLAEGRTVHICTMNRVIAISPQTVRSWEKAGMPLFKLVDGDLYIASGKRFNKLTVGPMLLVGLRAV